MNHPYIPPQPDGPGAYEQQLAARDRAQAAEILQLKAERKRLEDDLGQARQRIEQLLQRAENAEAARDQLAAGVTLVCSDERHAAKVRGLESALAALHEGEEPYEDERIVPTPGQWLWIWNRSTTAERLSMAAYRLELVARVHRCLNGMHESRIAQYDEDRRAAHARADAAEARLAELQNEDASDWFSGALFARKVTALWDAPPLSAAFIGDKPEPPDQAEPVTLTARHLSYQRPACTGCEWAAHPPLTCDEVAAFRDRFDGLIAEGLKEIRNEAQQ